MPPQCKKPRLCTGNFIDSLPVEILCMIFDRLHIGNLINASLACHRWNNIIFSSARIQLKINVLWNNPTLLKQFKKVFSKSKRCYRNVSWDIRTDQAIRSVWDIIHPKITRNLISLKITYFGKSIASIFALIVDEIPSMPLLRSLALVEYSGVASDQDIIPTLWSNSVNYLRAECHFKFRLDMPELQVFEGDLSALHRPDPLQTLPKLKHLIVHHNDSEQQPLSITAAKSIFKRLTNIETMQWNSSVSDEILNAICEICTSLKDLEIHWMTSNVANVANLQKLTNLRSLRVEHICLDSGTQYTDYVFDWSELSQIEQLQLGLNVNNALKLPISIKKLEVCIHSDNENDMIKTIIGCPAHLIELHVTIIDGSNDDYEEPIKLLEALSHLKNLEVLTFCGGHFLESSFLVMDTPLVHMRKLRFCRSALKLPISDDEFSEISDPNLQFCGIEEYFPNLREPEFLHCFFVPQDESGSDDGSSDGSYYEGSSSE